MTKQDIVDAVRRQTAEPFNVAASEQGGVVTVWLEPRPRPLRLGRGSTLEDAVRDALSDRNRLDMT